MASRAPHIVVLTGLPQERDCLQHLPDATGLNVVCSAGRPEAGRRQVETLVEAGCEALVSFGICGGLSPHLSGGTIVVADRVVDANGGCWMPCGDWSRRIVQQLDRIGAVDPATVLGSDRMVCEPEDKEALWRRHAVAAVDMESHVIARVGARAGLPIAVVRAVVDTAAMRLPDAARVALDAEGNPRHAAVARALLRRPLQLPDLIRLALAFRTALRRLRACAPLLGPDFRLFG